MHFWLNFVVSVKQNEILKAVLNEETRKREILLMQNYESKMKKIMDKKDEIMDKKDVFSTSFNNI